MLIFYRAQCLLAIVTGPLHITVVHLVHDLTDNLSRSVVVAHPWLPSVFSVLIRFVAFSEDDYTIGRTCVAVSYTHLDVYKRQAVERSKGMWA